MARRNLDGKHTAAACHVPRARRKATAAGGRCGHGNRLSHEFGDGYARKRANNDRPPIPSDLFRRVAVGSALEVVVDGAGNGEARLDRRN